MGGKRDDALAEVNIAIKLINDHPSPDAEMKQLYPALKQMQKQLGGQ